MGNQTRTDCRSDEGKTVGLIDAAIAIFNVLPEREMDGGEIQEAIDDLMATGFFVFLVKRLEEKTLK